MHYQIRLPKFTDCAWCDVQKSQVISDLTDHKELLDQLDRGEIVHIHNDAPLLDREYRIKELNVKAVKNAQTIKA